MKKLIIATAILTTGFFASVNSNIPTSAIAKVCHSEDPKNLGSGDGAPPTPPPTKGH